MICAYFLPSYGLSVYSVDFVFGGTYFKIFIKPSLFFLFLTVPLVSFIQDLIAKSNVLKLLPHVFF